MMRPTGRQTLTALAVTAAVAFAGCSDGLGDLREQIAAQKKKAGSRIAPLPEVKPYESYAYTAGDLRSPFFASLIGEGDAQGGPRPDSKRPREYLEQYSLDTLRMVGTLRLGRENYGLVQTRDGLVHRVLPGNRLGQNDGTVLAITESKITLVELVPDGLGGYIERPAALALSD